MIEFYPVKYSEFEKGNFPLNHDCVLKVEFHQGVGIRSQLFTCRSQDSGTLSAIISSLVPVSKVIISSVDTYGL